MTASMQEAASRGEESTRVARNVCNTINGRGESSRSPIPARQRARPVDLRIDASKSITTTPPPRRIRAFPSEATSVSPATRRRNQGEQQELKELLLEGWEKGWLAMQQPDCCARDSHGRPKGALYLNPDRED